MPRDERFTYEVPAKYKHDLKVMSCKVCGRPMRVGIRTKKAPRCAECGIDAMTKHNTEMHEHRGEAYSKWRQAMRRYIESESTATLPPENGVPPESKE